MSDELTTHGGNAGLPRIAVVCALIERDGRLLMAQRPPHKSMGLQWEFAGGKIEPGEAPDAALVREIREELGVDIEVGRALPEVEHAYPTFVIRLLPFVCRLAAACEPQPHEHVAVRWCTPDEIAALDLAAADRPVLAHYCAAAS